MKLKITGLPVVDGREALLDDFEALVDGLEALGDGLEALWGSGLRPSSGLLRIGRMGRISSGTAEEPDVAGVIEFLGVSPGTDPCLADPQKASSVPACQDSQMYRMASAVHPPDPPYLAVPHQSLEPVHGTPARVERRDRQLSISAVDAGATEARDDELRPAIRR
jgi:hypothetical protein